MKTYRNLYPKLCSFENLYQAYRDARRGKRKHASVAAFEYDQEKELLLLRDELQARAWAPGPYHSFYIHDPKRRLTLAPARKCRCLRRPVPRPGGASRPRQRHRANLGSAVY